MITETFNEALKLSNKTYFLEEVNKLKHEKVMLKKKIKFTEEKLAIHDALLEKNDHKNWEIYQYIQQYNETKNAEDENLNAQASIVENQSVQTILNPGTPERE